MHVWSYGRAGRVISFSIIVHTPWDSQAKCVYIYICLKVGGDEREGDEQDEGNEGGEGGEGNKKISSSFYFTKSVLSGAMVLFY